MSEADLLQLMQNLETRIRETTTKTMQWPALSARVTEVRAAFRDIDTQLNSLAAQVAEEVRPLTEELNKLDTAMQTAEAVFTATSGRLGDVSEKLQASLDQVGQSHAEAKDAALEKFGEIDEMVDEISEDIDELMESTRESIEDMTDAAVDAITENLIEPVTELREECVAKIEELIEELVDNVLPDKREEVTGELLAKLQEHLDDMIDKLQEGFAEFRETILQGSDQANGSRMTSEAAMELLRTAFDPVLSELERVRSLAGTVGISI